MDQAEIIRRKKRREAEAQWRKILAYYMMERYEKQEKLEMARHAYQSDDLSMFLRGAIYGSDVMAFMMEKGADGKSLYDNLCEMEELEPEDSPFRGLLNAMRQKPVAPEEVERRLADVVEQAPAQIVDRVREREERKLAQPQPAPEEEKKYAVDEKRLGLQMAFLRRVMPPKLYAELCNELTKAGRITDPEKDFRRAPREREKEQPQQQQQLNREQYMKKHRVEPQEKAGKLANAGDVYGAAAYMLAAWEQRGEREFDEAKADARAMELSGSRAFKAYMKGHPGSLMAAARGTAVAETSAGVQALDADLSHRDAVLVEARDNLKKMATGKTACFHQMLNTLERFTNEDTEPSEQERGGLVNALADYVMTDCAPSSRELNTPCLMEAMRAVKVLVPEQKFDAVLEQVNMGRSPQLKAEELERSAAPKEPEREVKAPERVLTREANEP